MGKSNGSLNPGPSLPVREKKRADTYAKLTITGKGLNWIRDRLPPYRKHCIQLDMLR